MLAVAVSGGADSLYSLLTLQEQGESLLALHGVFLPPALRSPDYPRMLDALSAQCAALGIPLHIIDFAQEFSRLVIEPFTRDYAAGLTPNPCARCNAAIKFGLLLQKARDIGADFLATGHYACIEHSPQGPVVYTGQDSRKDQSYFLALVPRLALAGALFPLGGLYKRDIVQSLAAQGICPPQSVESQEICFIPPTGYQALLPELAQSYGLSLPGPGPMLLAERASNGELSSTGKVLGRHTGLWCYTEGQRRGLGLAYSEPLYALGKDIPGNALLVGIKNNVPASVCRCGQLNLLLPWEEASALRLFVRTRYRQPAAPAMAEYVQGPTGPELILRFLQAADLGAPGQVAALYGLPPSADENTPLRLLGGGIILA